MTISRRTLGRFFDAYLYIFGSRMAAYKLNRLANGDNDIAQLVDLAFTFKYNGKFPKPWSLSIKPLQVKSEITALCRLVQELNPKTIVEIGTASGGTLFLFAHVVNPDLIISVDLPGGGFGGGYPFWMIPFFKSLGKKHAIQLFRADSHNEKTFANIKLRLQDHKIDLLFIDGDHTYQGVKKDFQMYSPLVREGGIVAFHDIVTHDPNVGCEVDKFWKEIKQSHRYAEIIEEGNQKWAGIGVLYL